MKPRVFVSWSGDRSRAVAMALRDWIPDVLHHVDAFVSEEDIAKGQRGLEVIKSQLQDAAAGVICLTPENMNAPWILFEAGALSNSIGAKDLLCPLLIGLQKADVQSPMSQFQLTSPDRTDIFRLVASINASFDSGLKASDAELSRRFERMWPELDLVLGSQIKTSPTTEQPVKRSQEDLLVEVLDIVRELRREQPSTNSERLGVLIPESEWPDEPHPDSRFKPGDRVVHRAFGEGKVIKSKGVGQRETALVNFKKLGVKQLKVAFAKMDVVSTGDRERGEP